MSTRIHKFANDPVIYYLHKNRNFIRKLQPEREEKTSYEEVLDTKMKIDENFEKQIRDMYYISKGVNPHNAAECERVGPYKQPRTEDIESSNEIAQMTPIIELEQMFDIKKKAVDEAKKMINQHSSQYMDADN